MSGLVFIASSRCSQSTSSNCSFGLGFFFLLPKYCLANSLLAWNLVELDTSHYYLNIFPKHCCTFHVQWMFRGYLRSHWTPPSGNYSPRIAPADAIVINFWPKKSSCGVVKSLFEANVKKSRNRPSTQLIEATSCVESWNPTIKAEELT